MEAAGASVDKTTHGEASERDNFANRKRERGESNSPPAVPGMFIDAIANASSTV
jgi:hypothetical protein